MVGHVRDDMPRMMLRLLGVDGPLSVEVVLDTGFDGDLVLPSRFLRDLYAEPDGEQSVEFAGPGRQRTPRYICRMEWMGEWRDVEILIVDGRRALLGTKPLDGTYIQIEMRDGGEVSIEEI
jgi:clan AA aspartic protease